MNPLKNVYKALQRNITAGEAEAETPEASSQGLVICSGILSARSGTIFFHLLKLGSGVWQ
jgi:hypothetical protein